MNERERQVRRASQTRRIQILTDDFMQRWREARDRVCGPELLVLEAEIEPATAIRPLTDEDLAES